MLLYQFSNYIQIIFVVLFSVLLIAATIASILSLPLIRLLFQNNNSFKARILLLPIIVVIYTLCISIIVFSAKNIPVYSSNIIATDIEDCYIIKGEIVELEKTPQYARGAVLVSYHIKFKIDNLILYINTDVGIPVDQIDLWNEGETITVYFKIINGKNIVIRAIKEQ